jgi:general secretion pathway protein F
MSNILILGGTPSEPTSTVEEVLSTDATPASATPSSRARSRKTKTTPKDVARSLRDLANLLEAGIPEQDALKKLGERSSSPTIAEAFLTAWSDMQAGDSLAKALGKQEKLIPKVARELIRAGVTTDALHANLRRAADSIIQTADVRGALKKKLREPATLLAITFATFWLMVSYAFPNTETMGPIVQGLVAGMQIVANVTVVALVVALVGLAIAGIWWKAVGSKNVDAQLRLDRFLLRRKRVGAILRMDTASKFAAVLAATTAAGLDEQAALKIAGEACGSPALSHHIAEHLARMKQGADLASAFDTEYLPVDLGDRVANQVTPDKRTEVLFRSADDYQKESFTELADYSERIISRVNWTSLFVLGVMMIVCILPPVLGISYQVQQINV